MNRPRAQQDRRDRRNSRRKSLQSPKRLRVETLERRRLLAGDTFLPALPSSEIYSASNVLLHAPLGEVETLDLAANRDTQWFDPSDSSMVGVNAEELHFGQTGSRPEDLGQVDRDRLIELQLASIVIQGEADLTIASSIWPIRPEPGAFLFYSSQAGWGPSGDVPSNTITIDPRPAIIPTRIRPPATRIAIGPLTSSPLTTSPLTTSPLTTSPLTNNPLASNPLGASHPVERTPIQKKPTVDTIIDIGINSPMVDSSAQAVAAIVADGPSASSEFMTTIPTTPSVTFRVEPIMARHHRIEVGQATIAPATTTVEHHESTSRTNTYTVTANDVVALHEYTADESTDIDLFGDSQATNDTTERQQLLVRVASQTRATNTSGGTVAASAATAANTPPSKSEFGEVPAATAQEMKPAILGKEFENEWRHAVDLLMAGTAGLIILARPDVRLRVFSHSLPKQTQREI